MEEERKTCYSLLNQYKYLLNKQQAKLFKEMIRSGDIDSFKKCLSAVIKRRYNI